MNDFSQAKKVELFFCALQQIHYLATDCMDEQETCPDEWVSLMPQMPFPTMILQDSDPLAENILMVRVVEA